MENKKRILVVEDNDFVRMQMVSFLQEDGYDTAESIDGASALKILPQGFDLIIADIRMEPMGGFEFIKIMRGEGDKTPVILATGDDTPDVLSEGTRLGVAAVLKKPVHKDRLMKTISRTLHMDRRTH